MRRNIVIKVKTFGIAIFLVCVHTSALAQKPQAASTSTVTQLSAPLNIDRMDSDRPAFHVRNPRYQLCKDDVFDLDFPFSPEFNQTTTVQPDGYISLLGLGDLHVEGQTIPELTQSLRVAYAKILHEPVITVVLKDFDRPSFSAFGQVGKPGKYDLRGDITVTQAIAIAGGLSDMAKHSQVLLFRRVSSDWYGVRKINVKQLLRGENLDEDLHLQPGDMLFVPKNTIAKIKPFIPMPNVGMYVPLP
jgi:polysaccharide export outer membrane protein